MPCRMDGKNVSRMAKERGKTVCKPGSVSSQSCRDSHSSGTPVTGRLEQPTRKRPRATAMLPYLVLLRSGFTLPLPLPAARCALTAPFHPYLPLTLTGRDRRYIFCGTFRRLAPPRRYLATCPVEPGLSSVDKQQRLSDRLPVMESIGNRERLQVSFKQDPRSGNPITQAVEKPGWDRFAPRKQGSGSIPRLSGICFIRESHVNAKPAMYKYRNGRPNPRFPCLFLYYRHSPGMHALVITRPGGAKPEHVRWPRLHYQQAGERPGQPVIEQGPSPASIGAGDDAT